MAVISIDLESFLQPLNITAEQLSGLALQFADVFKYLAANSLDQFLATPVNILPNGSERGRFISVDLGGTNLRVALVELQGVSPDSLNVVNVSHERSWSIEDRIKYDKAEDLFSWVGDCIAAVIEDCQSLLDPQPSAYNPQTRVVPVGITFSFPMIQSTIRDATLMPMGKGFAISSNAKLGHLLSAGYLRHTYGYQDHHLPLIEITAITNDSIATLASLAYITRAESSNRVVMGLIVGTGVNATVPLKLRDLHWSKRAHLKLPTSVSSEASSTIVNTEFTIKGAFSPLQEFQIVTPWDEAVDKSTEIPGFQPFEYMTGGRYIGELVRVILLDWLCNVCHVEREHLPTAMTLRNGITALFLSKTVASASDDILLTQLLREQLPPIDDEKWTWTSSSAVAFRQIAALVSERSAALVAAATVGLLICSEELQVKSNSQTGTDQYVNGFNNNFWKEADHGDLVVAYTGGTISHYPGYLTSCQTHIDQLVSSLTTKEGKAARVLLREARNGGIIGAGVLAGTVWNLPRRGSDTFSVPPPSSLASLMSSGNATAR